MHLQSLSGVLVQPLRVSHFKNDIGNFFAELASQLLPGRLRIFDCVVQKRCRQHDHVVNITLGPQDGGKCDRVVDVGRSLGILATLITMLPSREFQRS